MTGGDPYEPLWARSLAHQPQPEHDVVDPAPDEAEEVLPQPAARQPVGRRVIAIGVVAAIATVWLATALPGNGWATFDDVPSYWEEVPMTCDTMRIERDEGAVEWFRCHAVGGGALPPGDYRSPDARWTSDITGRDARANEIEITADGEVTGWATYP